MIQSEFGKENTLMKVFNVIFGILAVLAGFYAFCYPGMMFLSYGWMVAVLLGGWGLCAVVNYFSNRKKAKQGEGTKAVNGVLSLVLGIAAAIIAIAAMVKPGAQLKLDIAIICMFAIWLIYSGCSSIATALTVGRKLKTKTWGWTLTMGIIVLLCGLYGICHLFLMAQTMGLMFGATMMVYGVRMICSVFEKA